MAKVSEGTSRRAALRQFATFVAASPLVGQDPSVEEERPGTIVPPQYSADIMEPINLHEFEDAAKKKINKLAYDYIAGGAADELTLTANREAYDRFWIRRRVMNDVSTIDTSLTLLGQQLEHPILLAPAGAKPLLHPEGDRVCAQAAKHTKSIYVVGAMDTMAEMSAAGEAPTWWSATLGQATKADAEEYAKRAEDAGASALSVSVDYPYTASRDRNARNQFDLDWIRTGEFSTGKPPRDAFQVGMMQAYTPSMTWEYLSWLHGATDLPVLVKGIVTGEDAVLAVENGADMGYRLESWWPHTRRYAGDVGRIARSGGWGERASPGLGRRRYPPRRGRVESARDWSDRDSYRPAIPVGIECVRPRRGAARGRASSR